MTAALRLAGVSKRFRVYRQRNRSLKDLLLQRRLGVWEERDALRDVDLEIPRGRSVGLIGPNGAGKSTALKVMAGVLLPETGTVERSGRLSALIELGAGFHPDYTGRENVFLNASLLGLSGAETRRRFDSIVAFAELEPYVDQAIRTYSSGMQLRLGFAVAIHADAEIMLLDEILAVGDESFQRKCFDYVTGFQRAGGTTVLVSHSLDSVRRFCSDAVWIESGGVRAQGSTPEVVDAYINHVYRSAGHLPDERLAAEGAVKLGALRITSGGRVAELIQTGQDLGLEIPYQLRRPVAAPVFTVAIHRASDGEVVYWTSTFVDGAHPPGSGPGGLARLTYPEVRLLPGRYRISIGVHENPAPGTLPVDSHIQRYPFEVGSDGGGDSGLVRLPHRWDFEA